MGSSRAFSRILRSQSGGAVEVAPDRRPPATEAEPPRRDRGVALFMVISAMSVLAVLVTEFTYIAQINQKLAFDALDQVKAHYLAKSALKLSLLRLKAYVQVKDYIKNLTGGAGAPGVPTGLLDKIWSFPFIYPIPTGVPGLTPADRERIEKFQKESALDGRFTALIESESSKYNLNMILAQYQPPAPTASPKPNQPRNPNDPGNPNNPGAQASPTPFDPKAARDSLAQYLQDLLNARFEQDPDFAFEYRDFKMEDLIDNIAGWADSKYERRQSGSIDPVPMKRAPFYSLSELHMISPIDDTLYGIFAPALTVTQTRGININTMQEPTLRALVPQITADEVKEFFKFRDSEEEDNLFKDEDGFWKWVTTGVSAFRGDQAEVNRRKESLAKRNIRLVTDETEFKVTVQGVMNQATRTIEAWVTLGTGKKTPPKGGQPPQQPPGAPGAPADGTQAAQPAQPDPGLKITFMKLM